MQNITESGTEIIIMVPPKKQHNQKMVGEWNY